MQMGNILENVLGLLCFCVAQLSINASLYDVNFVQYTKMTSEHLLSANLTTRKYIFVLQIEKN